MLKIISKLFFNNNNKFAIGVSGGVDSISCAHFLAKKFKNRCVFFHANNDFVSGDKIAKEKVIEFANELGITAYYFDSHKKYEKGKSKEDWARKERFFAFNCLAKESSIKDIVLCHHLNDAVSSHLFNVFRGKESHFPIPMETQFEHYRVFRPFLLNEKQDFIKYADKYNLNKYVVYDELNDDMNLARNFISRAIIPIIHSKVQFNLNKVVKKKILDKIYFG